MGKSRIPAWLDDARRYCSLIGDEPSQSVSVFDWNDLSKVTDDSPGPVCLRLEARSRCSPRMRMLDSGGHEMGVIRSEGLVPWVRYAMRRDGELVWTLSVRSIVRSRHTLELANGDSWTFRTPFFSIQVMGSAHDAPRLVGNIGSSLWVWNIWVEPGWDSIDLLAAVAFMHRQCFHS